MPGIEPKPTLPFLKWAGGKRWLVERHRNLFPQKFGTYIEPFLGSGAVFFSLAPKKSILSDINDDLINAYRALRDDHSRVWAELKRHHSNHSPEYYYQMRAYAPRAPYTKAARLIYLNRTCWNGLYRVNLSGKFNVPKGTKSQVVLPSDDFSAVASALNASAIDRADFEHTINSAKRGDFLFVDPPYTVQHNLNGFIKYNETLFSWDDQIRLSKAVRRAKNRGVIIMITNANHESIRRLYQDDFNLSVVERPSVISGWASGRTLCTELIIRG